MRSDDYGVLIIRPDEIQVVAGWSPRDALKASNQPTLPPPLTMYEHTFISPLCMPTAIYDAIFTPGATFHTNQPSLDVR
ncbi:hypothetical protein Trydic_g12466 [Trypoxylus dichotomus]